MDHLTTSEYWSIGNLQKFQVRIHPINLRSITNGWLFQKDIRISLAWIHHQSRTIHRIIKFHSCHSDGLTQIHYVEQKQKKKRNSFPELHSWSYCIWHCHWLVCKCKLQIAKLLITLTIKKKQRTVAIINWRFSFLLCASVRRDSCDVLFANRHGKSSFCIGRNWKEEKEKKIIIFCCFKFDWCS